jgi:hypothetical protein
MGKTHYVKIRPEHYRDIVGGKKRAAVRLDDRSYAAGDIVIKRVWENGAYTGESVSVRITYILGNTRSFAPFVVGYVCFCFEIES